MYLLLLLGFFTDYPLFTHLNLLIIGSHGSGKNSVGNFILNKKSFGWWDRFKTSEVKKTHETRNGRKVSVVRLPGWNGDLTDDDKDKELRLNIVHYVNESCHAVVFVINTAKPFSDKTTQTIEKLLTEKVWHHTIVVLRNIEKLGKKTEAYLQTESAVNNLIQKCGKKYLDSNLYKNRIIQQIEKIIANKDQIYFQSNEQDKCEKTKLLKRIQVKINLLDEVLVQAQNESSHLLPGDKEQESDKRELQMILMKLESEINEEEYFTPASSPESWARDKHVRNRRHAKKNNHEEHEMVSFSSAQGKKITYPCFDIDGQLPDVCFCILHASCHILLSYWLKKFCF